MTIATDSDRIDVHSKQSFNGKTQMEIADEIGISQAQVSRLEKNALKAMKKYME